MISRFAFHSFKQVNPTARVRFRYIILVLLAVVLIGAFRAAALLVLFGGYALSAPTVWLFRKLRRRNRPVPHHE
jgi:phosphatidylserine synthase